MQTIGCQFQIITGSGVFPVAKNASLFTSNHCSVHENGAGCDLLTVQGPVDDGGLSRGASDQPLRGLEHGEGEEAAVVLKETQQHTHHTDVC